MSESLSNRPNLAAHVSEHNDGRGGIYDALKALKESTNPQYLRFAAEQLIPYQKRLPETYEQVATAYIDAGQVDEWISDFITEDEKAICYMLEDLRIDGSDDHDGVTDDMYFKQMPEEEMRRLAQEYAAGVTEPQPVTSINGYIAPEFAGKHALKYEYMYKIEYAINNFVDTLPESTQTIVAEEHEIYQFGQMLAGVDNPLEHDELFAENIDDGQLVVRLLERSVKDEALSKIISEYEDAKTAYATTLEQISRTPVVRVIDRHTLYRTVRVDINTLSYRFNLLCDEIKSSHANQGIAARTMAALWRQDRDMLGAIINSLSNGEYEYQGNIDPAIDMYAGYFMGVEPNEDDAYGNLKLSRRDVISYYTTALDIVAEKVKTIR